MISAAKSSELKQDTPGKIFEKLVYKIAIKPENRGLSAPLFTKPNLYIHKPVVRVEVKKVKSINFYKL